MTTTPQDSAQERERGLAQAIEHHMAGRYDEAQRLYLALHERNRRDEEVLYLLGVLCCDLGAFDAACRFLREALQVSPGFPEAAEQLVLALNGLGVIQLEQEKYAEAERTLREALAAAPDLIPARNNLGLALRHQGRLAEAAACFEEVLARDPAHAGAAINLANVLRLLGRPEEARERLEQVLAAQPDSAEALNNLGTVLQDLGRPGEARACLERAAALDPVSPRIRWNLALAQLLLGDYGQGWANYESRWEGCPHLRGAYDKPPGLAWRGEPLAGKRLLAWAEQGFGDTLQFVRFAADLAKRGATVIVEVQPELAALARTVPGVAEVVPRGAPLPPYDFHCPLMSLPHRLDLGAEAVPAPVPYLTPDPERTARWAERLAAFPGRKVGLAWAGRSRGQSAELAAIDARRSVRLGQLAPLLAGRKESFFSLQKGPQAVEIVENRLPVYDFSSEWADFSDTAAFIANLDLVISVDTAVAHLAGALGKPVWLLNRHDTCWRWLETRTDSPWYPTLRQFRQPRGGDWATPIAEAAGELAKMVN